MGTKTLGARVDNVILMASARKGHLRRLLLRATGGNKSTKVLVDVKTRESILEKVVRKGRSPEQLGDILRAAVLLGDKEDPKRVLKKLRKLLTVVSEEYKEGNSSNPYKGAWHLDVMIEGMQVELQIMPRSLWPAKEVAHEAYKAGNASEASSLFGYALCIAKARRKMRARGRRARS